MADYKDLLNLTKECSLTCSTIAKNGDPKVWKPTFVVKLSNQAAAYVSAFRRLQQQSSASHPEEFISNGVTELSEASQAMNDAEDVNAAAYALVQNQEAIDFLTIHFS